MVNRRANRFLCIGAALLAGFVFLAVLGPSIAPEDADHQDLMALLQPPGARARRRLANRASRDRSRASEWVTASALRAGPAVEA